MSLPEIRDKRWIRASWRLELALKYGSRAHSTMVSQLLTLISHFLVALEAGAFCLSLQALRLRQMSVHYRLTGREHCPPAIHKQPMKTAGFRKRLSFQAEIWELNEEIWELKRISLSLTTSPMVDETGNVSLNVALCWRFCCITSSKKDNFWPWDYPEPSRKSRLYGMTTDSREISASSKAQGRK